MMNFLKYRRVYLAVLSALPDINQAIKEATKKVNNAKADKNVTKEEALDIAGSVLIDFAEIMAKIALAYVGMKRSKASKVQ